MPNNLKIYDGMQVLRSVFDIDKNCLRVCVVDGSTGGGGGFEVIISHTSDSIRIGDGTNLISATNLLGKTGLDVNVINDIDIRQLDHTTDNVAIHSSGNQLSISSRGEASTLSLNKLIDVPYDDIEITAKNTDGDPTQVTFRSSGVLVRVLTLTYDSDGDLQRVQRT